MASDTLTPAVLDEGERLMTGAPTPPVIDRLSPAWVQWENWLFAHAPALIAAARCESELRDALTDMTRQFAYWYDGDGGYTTGGLSVLESAFDALGWLNPQPEPQARCDEPGCLQQATCGTPTPGRYRWTCSPHHRVLVRTLAPSGEQGE